MYLCLELTVLNPARNAEEQRQQFRERQVRAAHAAGSQDGDDAAATVYCGLDYIHLVLAPDAQMPDASVAYGDLPMLAWTVFPELAADEVAGVWLVGTADGFREVVATFWFAGTQGQLVLDGCNAGQSLNIILGELSDVSAADRAAWSRDALIDEAVAQAG